MRYGGRCPVMRALFAVAAICAAPLARAQTAAGVLAGRVTDAFTGAGVADVEVSVTGPASATTHTTAGGAWRIVALVPGRYEVRFRRAGYAGHTVTAEVEEAVPATASPSLTVAITPVPVSLDAIVITSARREQRLKDAVATTELISHEAIKASGAQDVGTVLYEQTGIQLEGGIPAGTGAFLQGLGSQRVLVLVDGQPLVGRVNGTLDLSRLPTSMIDHIEVVKGPQSTLYGSEAMGGVINIITRRPGDAPMRASLAALGGTHGLLNVDAGAQGATPGGAFGYNADLGIRQISLAPGVSGDNGTQADHWDANGAVRWTQDSTLSYNAGALAIFERQRWHDVIYHFADNQQIGGRVGATLTHGRAFTLAPVLSFSSFYHLSRAATVPQPVSDSGATDLQQLMQLELPMSARLGATTLDAGLDLKRESIRADRVPGGERVINGVGPYAEVTLTKGDWSLVPGVRASWSEQWGSAVTPRVAALWRPLAPLAVRFSAGAGYRAPDFKELYIDFVNPQVGYTVIGNPNLRPERSVGVASDVEWAGAHAYGRVDAYYNKFRDFIESVGPDASNTYTYANVAQGTTSGLELEAGVTQGALRAEAGYAYLHTRDDATGGPLLGRPANTARIMVGAGLTSWLQASVTGLYTGVTPVATDSTGRVTDERPSYVRFDVRAVARVPLSLELVAGVNNVFDKQLGPAWPGFTGRVVYAGVTWRTAVAE